MCSLPLQVHCVRVDQVIGSVIQCQNATYCFFKCRCYIDSIFSASLKVRMSTVFPTPLPHILPRHLPLGHIQFVAQYHKREVVRVLNISVISELFLPVGQVAEALSVIKAEGEQAAVRAAVERRAEAAEALLTRRVPDLESDVVAVHLQLLVQEFHTNGVEKVRVKLIGNIAVHE